MDNLIEIYKEFFSKVYETSKTNYIKKEEEWAKQEAIYLQMVEDRKRHVEKCKNRFSEQQKKIAQEIALKKTHKCVIPQHAFRGQYGYSDWYDESMANGILGPNYSDKANELRQQVIEAFHSELPGVSEGYMYKVSEEIPHYLYKSDSTESAKGVSWVTQSHVRCVQSGVWVYMGDYNERDEYGRIKNEKKYTSMIYESTKYIRTYEDAIYCFGRKIPDNIIKDKNYAPWENKWNREFQLIFDAMPIINTTTKTEVYYCTWNYPKVRCVDVVEDGRRRMREAQFQTMRKKVKKEFDFLSQINKDYCIKADYNKWVNSKGSSDCRKKGFIPVMVLVKSAFSNVVVFTTSGLT